MRCDQIIGLNNWARSTVGKKQSVLEKVQRTYKDGKTVRFKRWRRVPIARIHKIGSIEGTWTKNVAGLHRYALPDGRVYEEFVQATPWSSGPCYFLALKDVQTGLAIPESLWTREQLGSC